MKRLGFVLLALVVACGSPAGREDDPGTDPRNDGGSGSTTPPDGGSEPGCSDGCSDGARTCVAGGVATCVRLENGCLGWSAPQACSGSDTCSGGACVSHCSDQCTEGEERCSGAQVQACVRQQSGCTDWGVSTPCASGTCTGAGTCTATCTDRCTAGAKRCAGSGAEESCVTAASGCLDWSRASCGAGTACTTDHCAAPGGTCEPGCPNGFSCHATNVCSGGSATGLLFNEEGFAVSGRITVNGATPNKDATYCAQSGNLSDQMAIVEFVEPHKGYVADVDVTCSTSGFDFSTLLPPGTWDVRVKPGRYAASASVNLVNVAYLAKKGLVVSAPVTNLVLAEQAFSFAGRITVNGAVPHKDATYCTQSGNTSDQMAHVTFVDAAQGYDVGADVLCSTHDFDVETLLPPGNYDVRITRGRYATSAGVDLLPVDYLARQGLAVTGPQSNVVLEERGFAVGGRVTINGATPNKDATYCQQSGNTSDQMAIVRFVEKTKGYEAPVDVLCNTNGFDFATVLPPGTWDVSVSRGRYATSANVDLLPVDYLAKQGLVVSAPVSNLMLAEQGFAVSGRITIDGATPNKDATYCQQSGNTYDQMATIHFLEPAKGYDAQVDVLCNSSGFDFATVLPPGTWDVRVAPGRYAGSAKVNLLPLEYLAKQGLVISAPVSGLVLAEQGFAVSGRITINGAAPNKDATYCQQSGNTSDQMAIIHFVEGTKGYDAQVDVLCNTNGFDFATVLPPGTWDARVSLGRYAGSAQVNLLPVSYLAKQGLVVSAPVSNVVLAEQGIPVSGRLTVNGAEPHKDATYCTQSGNLNDQMAIVRFVEPTKGYDASVDITCSSEGFSFGTTLPPGVWDVRVSRGRYASSAAVDLLPVDYLVASKLQLP